MIYGVGYMGNASTCDENGKKLRSWNIWHDILGRCYLPTHKRYKDYGAKGITICEEWKCFEIFKQWYDFNYYELEGEAVDLDKDILSKGTKIYSPQTCIFVPRKINSLFRSKPKNDGLPKGIYKDYKKYRVKIKINGKSKELGGYNTLQEAQKVYLEAKQKLFIDLVEQYKNEIPDYIYNILINTKIK